jgi:hypothetical protein
MNSGLDGTLAMATLALLLPGWSQAEERTFNLELSGEQAVPGPGDQDGQASGTLTIDDETGEVSWEFEYSEIAVPQAMHIHMGATGEGGGVVVPLNVESRRGEGTLAGSTTAQSDVVAAILASPASYYVNIHNAEFSGGAVRAQLED